ncbi:MAG: NAD(P)H-hydrate dehydratase [Planctomycetota bacterium]|mgnify:CR=1 FL=1
MLKIIKKLPRLTPRRAESHKGNFGKIFILAGSRGLTGAAYLCAKGALRSGAGLVLVGTPASQQPILAAKLTCAMTYPLPETKQQTLSLKSKNEIITLVKNSDVVALGPGLSQHPETVHLVQEVLLELNRRSLQHIPLVIDADGLNALSHRLNILKKIANPVILTPHPGEMSRLLNHPPEADQSQFPIISGQAQRIKLASDFAQKYGVIVVLKGHQTIVTDGPRYYINQTGNPGLASGGMGDVLTGMIAGLLGSGVKSLQDKLRPEGHRGGALTPFESAQLSVYLHGLAGDLAAKKIGPVSLLATDLLEYLPQAFLQHHHNKRKDVV